jgi:hypothetical protein
MDTDFFNNVPKLVGMKKANIESGSRHGAGGARKFWSAATRRRFAFRGDARRNLDANVRCGRASDESGAGSPHSKIFALSTHWPIMLYIRAYPCASVVHLLPFNFGFARPEMT